MNSVACVISTVLPNNIACMLDSPTPLNRRGLQYLTVADRARWCAWRRAHPSAIAWVALGACSLAMAKGAKRHERLWVVAPRM
jgi:hypothetical protein